ncbi:hypothetical protein N1851_014006 [Merluccius polli]|uniref:YqaJ viral recombinase domain-containing protein n=1 Tax=Merluccius polli TaxID=89951 RepID=A0AA47MU73_MERPO|nr:hypothetical protein N1851_014006 [Merluccius polli]
MTGTRTAILSMLPEYCDEFRDPIQPIRSLQSLANGSGLDRCDLPALQKHCQTIGSIADVSEDQAVGASPDAIVTCTCCGKGCIEVKCPAKYKDSTILDACSSDDRNFSLHVVDGQVHLKKNHQYYTQVQTQLFVTESAYYDFVVWTLKDCVILRFGMHGLKAQDFFVKVALPELVVQYFSIPPTSQVSPGPSVLRELLQPQTVVNRPRKKPAKKAPKRTNAVWCLCAGPEEGLTSMKAFFTSAMFALEVFLPTLKTGSGIRLGRSLNDMLHLFTSHSMPKRKIGAMGNEVLTLPQAEESARLGKACTKEDAKVFLVSAVESTFQVLCQGWRPLVLCLLLQLSVLLQKTVDYISSRCAESTFLVLCRGWRPLLLCRGWRPLVLCRGWRLLLLMPCQWWHLLLVLYLPLISRSICCLYLTVA